MGFEDALMSTCWGILKDIEAGKAIGVERDVEIITLSDGRNATVKLKIEVI